MRLRFSAMTQMFVPAEISSTYKNMYALMLNFPILKWDISNSVICLHLHRSTIEQRLYFNKKQILLLPIVA